MWLVCKIIESPFVLPMQYGWACFFLEGDGSILTIKQGCIYQDNLDAKRDWGLAGDYV